MNSITAEQAGFFEEHGYLILRGVLRRNELERLQTATAGLIEADAHGDPDYFYGAGHKTGAPVLRRIEYVVDKSDECKALLGHPFILNSVRLLVGDDLLSTWDSMVIKQPGEGIVVPWHRDAGTEFVGDKPIFNVDFYLDEADGDTCVYVIPGSHKWPPGRAAEWLAERRDADHTREDFEATGAIAALMEPGDVLFHNILVLHGSPANAGGKLRRVVYYEFRTEHVERELGPHTAEYIPLKQGLLHACIARRVLVEPQEEPFAYAAPAGVAPTTYRYPHDRFWRGNS